MGTRGIYGFYGDGKDKLTYNHFDSYPEGLGEDIVDFIRSTSVDEMRDIFNRIQLVDQDGKPTPEQIQACAEYTDLHVSNQSVDDWYCLLRKAQGDLGAYKRGLKYMSDDKDFIKDSLFCEWGYIINLDDEVLEVYRGFQKTPDTNPKNRYASDTPDGDGYYPCKLVTTFPLADIPENWIQLVKTQVGDEEEEDAEAI